MKVVGVEESRRKGEKDQGGTEGRTQEDKSTGDRNAQLSCEPEARSALTLSVCASAPL